MGEQFRAKAQPQPQIDGDQNPPLHLSKVVVLSRPWFSPVSSATDAHLWHCLEVAHVASPDRAQASLSTFLDGGPAEFDSLGTLSYHHKAGQSWCTKALALARARVVLEGEVSDTKVIRAASLSMKEVARLPFVGQ